MTQQQGQEANQSAFNQRSDNAAAQLKQAMGLPQTQVEVDAHGQPPAPPPPDGSYAAMQRDEAVAAQARIQQAEQPKAPVQQDPPPTPREQLTDDISDKAAERISDLVTKLRTKDQEFQTLQAQHTQTAEQIEKMQQLVEQLSAEREQLRKAQLDELDPEERQRVINEMQLGDAMQKAQEQILAELRPRLERIDQHELSREYEALATAYPGVFDPKKHPELIEYFRSQNPNCSVRLAFQATLEPHELKMIASQGAPTAKPVPPSIAPTHSGVPKNVPTQSVSQPNSDPRQEIAEESAAAYALLRKSDAVSQREGMRAVDDVLRKRLFGS